MFLNKKMIVSSSLEKKEKSSQRELDMQKQSDFSFESIDTTNIENHGIYHAQSSSNIKDTSFGQYEAINSEVHSLNHQLIELEEKKAALIGRIQKIQKNCTHQILVQIKPYDFKSIDNPYYCLICNKLFPDQFVLYDRTDKKLIIHFDYIPNIQPEEKIKIAYQSFKLLKMQNSQLTDEEIVDIINKKLIENPDSMINGIGFSEEKETMNDQNLTPDRQNDSELTCNIECDSDEENQPLDSDKNDVETDLELSEIMKLIDSKHIQTKNSKVLSRFFSNPNRYI